MTNKHALIYGIHAVTQLLENNPERILHVYVIRDRDDKKMHEILHLLKKQQISYDLVPTKMLDNLIDGGNHQGIVAECKKVKTYQDHDLASLLSATSNPKLILILDEVQDPHNLGACFRSAEIFGANMIIVPKDKSATITPVVSKVASGAAEIIPFVQVTNLARTIEQLKEENIWVYGASGEAEKSLYQINFKHSVAIILGAEGKGLRRLTQERCDELIKIPMQGSIASLNVSVAAGILLAEVNRQRYWSISI